MDRAHEGVRKDVLGPLYEAQPFSHGASWLWHIIGNLQPSTCSDPRDKIYSRQLADGAIRPPRESYWTHLVMAAAHMGRDI